MSDPRYPIGRFVAPAESSAKERAEQLNALHELPAQLRAAVEGLTQAQMDAAYREGGWTVRQVVHHVADSHMNSYVRFKLALTEDWPTIKPYDEGAWAKLADSNLPLEISLLLIEGLHARWVALLESLNEAGFARGYVHPKLGRQTLSTALALYAWHGRHHTAHITVLRARMGW
jgi:DinB superfamily